MNPKIDWYLVITYLVAAVISLTVLFSISPERLPLQAISLTIGFALLIYLSRQDHALFRSVGWPCYILTIVLLVATIILGENVRGAVRWINIGSFQFQASEFTKPLLILAFSHFFVTWPVTTLKNIGINIALFALPALLIFRQPDLGTSLVVASIWGTQFILAGAKWWVYAAGGLSALIAALIAPRFLHEYQQKRLESFIDPSLDPLGSGYNVIQSVIAVGSGGIIGKGLGHGTQSHLRFLPERHTDFIFASLAEELGLAGSLVVVTVLSFMLYRLLCIIMKSSSLEARLIVAGIFAYLAFQTFINIGMNIGIAPVTGITLPLISYGGSSVIAIAVSLGIAASVAQASKKDVSIEIK